MKTPKDPAAVSLTVAEKRSFEAWIIANVNTNVVPNDEGNSDALVFNLIHLLRGDGERYDYKPEQDAELETWRLGGYFDR
jgi:hypothetical protein